MEHTRAQQEYIQWVQNPALTDAHRQELQQIANDPTEIVRRFHQDIDFGTGGLRAMLGLGSTLWNPYTIGRVMQGIATYLGKQVATGQRGSIVIGYDTRTHSRAFAEEVASIMLGNGIETYLFAQPRPTAMISYAVRHYGAHMGIVVTASHNSKEYNGFKVYGRDGGQLLTAPSRHVKEAIAATTRFEDVRRAPLDPLSPHFTSIGERMDKAYCEAVLQARPGALAHDTVGSPLVIAYSPIHGTGQPTVLDVLKAAGHTHLVCDEEQMIPLGDFPTVTHPNPEDATVMQRVCAMAIAHEADVAMATDPDCDRLGVIYRHHDGHYETLTGNQIGVLLAEYVFEQHTFRQTMPQNPAMVTTIVTSELGTEVARHYGVHVVYTLTGFKYIAAQMTHFQQTHTHNFLFGYEESHGYLAGTYTRDKDGVIAALLVADAVAYYKGKGLTIADVFERIYARHGIYEDQTHAITLHGVEGMQKMKEIMQQFRQHPFEHIGNMAVTHVHDYLEDKHGLPQENVLKYVRADRSWCCVRPSGTEPKIKLYFSAKGKTREEAVAAVEAMKKEVMDRVQHVLQDGYSV